MPSKRPDRGCIGGAFSSSIAVREPKEKQAAAEAL
jgi:hypothetical protein